MFDTSMTLPKNLNVIHQKVDYMGGLLYWIALGVPN